jgi:hypothetical protein
MGWYSLLVALLREERPQLILTAWAFLDIRSICGQLITAFVVACREKKKEEGEGYD